MTDKKFNEAVDDLMRNRPSMTRAEAEAVIRGKESTDNPTKVTHYLFPTPAGGDTQLFGCPLPDGSRRVITTDKDGNLISIRKEPASAQSAVDPLQGTPSMLPPKEERRQAILQSVIDAGADPNDPKLHAFVESLVELRAISWDGKAIVDFLKEKSAPSSPPSLEEITHWFQEALEELRRANVDPAGGTPSSPPSWGVYEVKLHGSAEHGSDGYYELVRKVNSIPISTFVVLERAEEAKRELQDFFRRHVFNSVGQCYDRVRLHNATEKHSHYWSEGSCCWKVNPKYKAEGEE